MLITDPLSLYAQQTPQKMCIVSSDTSVTYQQFNKLINKTAHALLASARQDTAQEQHKVALLLDNRVELLQVFLAAAKIGWLAVVFDPKWTSQDVTTALVECNPDVLVIEDVYLNQLKDLPQAMQVIVLPALESFLYAGTQHTFSHWIQVSASDEPQVHASDTDLFYTGYTSGTTGKPKGFLRTHCSWTESFRVSNTAFAIDLDQHVLAPGPLAHSLSLYAATATLFVGATFYLVRRFDASTVLKLLASQPISAIYLVPTMFEALLQEKMRGPHYSPVPYLKSIISTGDKWSAFSKQQAEVLFPTANLYEFYGASELSFVSILDPEGNKHKPDSVGRPADGVSISIRDINGAAVKSGESGQLYVQSKMLFSGYYLNPEATNEVLQDGWATVGDLARQDKEGFIYLTGRKANMLISGGLNVYPEEVERVLLQVPQIDEALVIGLADAYWGDKIIALVKLRSGTSLQIAEIKVLCRERLPAYKCPQEIIQVATFPYTLSGKIARNSVYEQVVSRSLTK